MESSTDGSYLVGSQRGKPLTVPRLSLSEKSYDVSTILRTSDGAFQPARVCAVASFAESLYICAAMIPKSIHGYFFFGTCVRYLQDAREGYWLHSKSEGAYVLANLGWFFSKLDELNLQVTKRGASELKVFYQELTTRPPEDKLTNVEATRLRTFFADIRKLLDAELPGFKAYIVTPKRLDVERLLSEVKTLLSRGSFERLPSLAQYDLEEAGKCIAFERPTAAAFHLLRGTELVLREFYCELVKQNRGSLMWGNMIVDLRKRRRAKPYYDLVEHLDHIRKAFRNPTQHPDKIYDIEEVQELWSLCTDAISRMAKALKG